MEQSEATGHTPVTDPAIEATCITEGKTEGSHCSVCGEILIAQETVPATGIHPDADPGDGACDTCGCEVPEVKLISRSISLKGNIAVNYYMHIADHIAQDPEAYMLFAQEGKEPKKVHVSECTRELNYYIFTYEVAAKEMTDEIVGQFFYGEKQTEEYPYSVRTYANNVREKITDEALLNLIDAMLHYGAASQIQFDYHTERLANEGMQTPDYDALNIDSFAMSKEQGTELAPFAGATLVLKSETTLRFFFRLDASVEQFAVIYAGQELQVTERSGLHYVEITDISAANLDEVFTITIKDGSHTTEVSYSSLAYCASVRKNVNGQHPRTLLDVAAALYLYNQAANSYFEESSI